jgi:hypothetical protein
MGKKGRPSKGVLRAGMSRKCHLAITIGGSVEEGFLRGGNVNDLEVEPDLVQEVGGGVVMEDRGYDREEFCRLLK